PWSRVRSLAWCDHALGTCGEHSRRLGPRHRRRTGRDLLLGCSVFGVRSRNPTSDASPEHRKPNTGAQPLRTPARRAQAPTAPPAGAHPTRPPAAWAGGGGRQTSGRAFPPDGREKSFSPPRGTPPPPPRRWVTSTHGRSPHREVGGRPVAIDAAGFSSRVRG